MRGVFVILLLAAASAAEEHDSIAPVVDLNEWTLPALGDEPWLVFAHTSWCAHCRHAAPLFEAVAVPGVRRGRLDCTHRDPVCAELGFFSWPSVALVRGRRCWDMKAPFASAETVENWVRPLLADVDSPGARSWMQLTRVHLIQARAAKLLDLLRHDLTVLWDRHPSSVLLIAALGAVAGLLLGRLTSGRRTTGPKRHGAKKAKRD